ncbi:AAA family ATPase [Hyphomicrobium sp.]|uniref:AAA family ATPase n=1 Tax=Hyphomicrobium sp. TaxID=82 RepID=UPI0039E545B3
MQRLLIFGNSGSGKSTLARQLAQERGLAHLDLDTLAWQPGMPPPPAAAGGERARAARVHRAASVVGDSRAVTPICWSSCRRNARSWCS